MRNLKFFQSKIVLLSYASRSFLFKKFTRPECRVKPFCSSCNWICNSSSLDIWIIFERRLILLNHEWKVLNTYNSIGESWFLFFYIYWKFVNGCIVSTIVKISAFTLYLNNKFYRTLFLQWLIVNINISRVKCHNFLLYCVLYVCSL